MRKITCDRCEIELDYRTSIRNRLMLEFEGSEHGPLGEKFNLAYLDLDFCDQCAGEVAEKLNPGEVLELAGRAVCRI